MYGGLFGDLPAAKNSDTTTTTVPITTTTISCTESLPNSQTRIETTSNITTATTIPTTTSTTTVSSTTSTKYTSSSTTIVPTKMIVPHRIRPTIVQQQTSMRPRPRPRPPLSQSCIRKRPVSMVPPQLQPPLAATSAVAAQSSTAAAAATAAIAVDVVRSDNHNNSSSITIAGNCDGNTDSVSALDLPILGSSVESFSSSTKTSTEERTEKCDSTVNYSHNSIQDPTSTTHVQHQHQLEIDDRLRILNETSIEQNNIYNPMIPNDVLLYWEQQVRRQEQEQYEIERQQLLQEQEMIRQQLEQERHQLLKQAIRTEQQQQQVNGESVTSHVKDITTSPHAPLLSPLTTTATTNTSTTTSNEYYQKIIQQEQQRMMGRGRGNITSNLPAWLIQKQKQQQASLSSFSLQLQSPKEKEEESSRI
jgi:hypothetical protein